MPITLIKTVYIQFISKTLKSYTNEQFELITSFQIAQLFEIMLLQLFKINRM